MRLFSRVLSGVLLLLPAVNAVNKDEAYQNDWHIALIGASIPSSTFFHRPVLDAKASLIYTLTSRSILAAINPRDGSIVWRHLLGDGTSQGVSRKAEGAVIAAVDRDVKAFDAVDGKLIWETTFAEKVKDLQVIGGSIVAVLLENGSVVKVSEGNIAWESPAADSRDIPQSLSIQGNNVFGFYQQPSKGLRIATISAETGKLSSSSISASIQPIDRVHSSASIVAWTENSLSQIKFLVLGTKASAISVAVPEGIVDVKFQASDKTILVHYETEDKSWAEVYGIDRKKGSVNSLYSLDAKTARSAFSVTESATETYITWTLPNGEGFLYGSKSADVLDSYTPDSENPGDISVLSAISEVIPKMDKKYAVRTFVATSSPGFHGNTYLTRNGKSVWSRPESLVSVTASAWVELLDPAEEVAEELNVEGHKNVVGAYVHRLTRHAQELVTYGPDWFTNIPKRVMDAFLSNEIREEKDGKWRDLFGFRKYAVVATKEGGLAALDVGKKGAIVWEFSLVTSKDAGQWEGVQQIYEVSKGTVGVVTYGGIYYEIDAFEGKVLTKEAIGGRVKSSAILGRGGKSQVVMVVLEGDKIALLPPGSTLGEPAYIVVRGDAGDLKGLRVDNTTLATVKTWDFVPQSTEKIHSIVNRPAHDPIASIGKVLGDRSVMYKYINNNLLTVITTDQTHSSASIYILESVSGIILYSALHVGADTTKPITATMSENWLVYTYFGSEEVNKEPAAKGYHLVVSELFEHHLPNYRSPLHPAKTYSALAGSIGRPHVCSQSYIFPTEITSLGVTTTKQGITTREVLALMPWSSSIIALPKRLLDPRRPVEREPNEAEREEGLMKYAPALEIDPRSVINHKQELLGITDIVTTPAQLESTSIIFAYGGDLFGTRVTPSMPFDVLGKGFSKIQLVGTILALGVGVGFVAPMVRRKQINQRWLDLVG
ncbi:DUF1620-domain-containing protein [Choiromyces venosus 120613-1]|uniref:ER membrane protein complex subunit 1 n=1 Tax=Choiromyces venosus 120613-1 TaxID=1336337 RepID=A0A3N4J6V2_9PEZI|nr:DUF1620-domain-containing protein [Choiromyces venosus 120613-1]